MRVVVAVAVSAITGTIKGKHYGFHRVLRMLFKMYLHCKSKLGKETPSFYGIHTYRYIRI